MDISLLSKQELNQLKRSEIFKGLNEKQLIEIIEDDDCLLVSFKRKDSIYDNSEYLKAFGYVRKGKAIIKSQSSVYLMRYLDKNSFFGVMGLFCDDIDYVSEIEARSDMEIIFFKQNLIERCIKRYPEFSINLIKFLTGRISYLNKKINVISNNTNTDKLASFIHLQIENSGSQFIINESYAKLCERLNMSRASLYRSFDELIDKKLIEKDNKRIIVKDISYFDRY